MTSRFRDIPFWTAVSLLLSGITMPHDDCGGWWTDDWDHCLACGGSTRRVSMRARGYMHYTCEAD